MKTRYSPIPLIVIALAVGCSSAPAPKAQDDATRKESAAAAAKKKDSLTRADEIIADLRKREAEQGKIQQRNRQNVPVVVEVSPTGQPKPAVGTAGGFAAAPSSRTIPVMTGPDPNRMRQEVSIAEAQLTAAQQRLQTAQQRLSMAQAQANDQNAAVRKMGQAALQAAQSEVNSAQNAVYQAQSVLEQARYRVR